MNSYESRSPARLRFLFALWEGGGNVPPTLSVANRLQSAGHSVRLIGDPCQEEDALGAGIEFVAWRTPLGRTNRQAETDLLRDWEAQTPPELIAKLRDNLFFGPAEQYARDVDAELNAGHFDCLVTSDMLFGPAIAAEAHAVPYVFLAANIYLYPRPGVPPFGPGLQPAKGPAELKRDEQISAMLKETFGEATEAYNRARAVFNLAPLSHPFDQLERARGVLMLTSQAFDFSPSIHNPRHVYAGPELGDPPWAEPWSSKWNSSDTRPLVLVAMSSTYQAQEQALIRIAHVLARMDVRAVITSGLAINPDVIPEAENVAVCRSAPHSAILRDASLMITHCGHGSVMRGLAAGVPLLCLPMGRDQNDNAARVEFHGAGLRIEPGASEETLFTAVRQLLTDPSFRNCAETLGHQLRHDYENSTAVSALENWANPFFGTQQQKVSAAA